MSAAPPDFNLAPFTKFDPRTFASGREDVDRFVLMLGLIYNDLKSPFWLMKQATRAKEQFDLSEISPALGQIAGFHEWGNRQTIAILRELLTLIKENHNILQEKPLLTCIESLPSQHREAWAALTTASTAGASKDPFVKYLIQIRNNVSFHYNQTEALFDGYRRHFVEDPPSPINEVAYASLGDTMEGTRFYFADAAAQGYLRSVVDPTGELYEMAGDYLDKVNLGLRGLIHAYLLFRELELSSGK
jgi:hypothetical protein